MYVYLAIAAAVFSVGFGVGDRMATGRYQSAMLVAETNYRDAQDAAVKAASRELEAQSQRAVSAAEARGRRSALAQEVINEIPIAPDTRDCEWTDTQRLRIERIYSTYGVDPDPAAARVPNPLPAAPTD